MDDVFCINPFVHLLVETNGRTTFCCTVARAPTDQNINTHEVDDAWHDPVRKSVIESIHRGEQNPACRFCWRTESLGAVSHRQIVNKRFFVNQSNYKKFLPLITPGETFVDMEIQHTNICNLKCGMCSEKSTHSLAAENRRLGITERRSDNLTVYDWDIKKISHKISQTKWFTIRGGEPLINEHLKDQVNQWIDEGLLDNTTVCIVTNATKIDSWLHTLERIPKLQFMVSADGVSEVYNYIRFPGDWDTTSANILKLQTIAPVMINCVVQNVNIFSLDKLIEWADKNKIPIDLYPIDNPRIYRTMNLPQGLLDSSLNKLEQLNPTQKRSRDQLNGIIQYLKSHTSDMELWDEFWHMTYMRQSIRKNSILDVFPELSNYERPRL
jgi:molybdenum cofactor biosynthesis enzyme MoaA